jgi:glycosyltransferase involved in cell wall biosynthesis
MPALNGRRPVAGDALMLCSIVLASRDEEDRIEKTIRTLLEQLGVAVEIIAVDDRSSRG